MGGASPAPADPLRALFAAGGTGGHIWPAVAVSRALRSHDPRWQCHFVGGDRPVEAEVYAAAGVSPAVIHVPPPSAGRWRTWLAMMPAILRARRLIRTLRPHVVLSTGGYVAAPVAAAAWWAGIPCLLLEPNAVPGRVTRRLARRVAAVALADSAAARLLRARRVEVTGTPVMWRPAELNRPAARAKWGIPEHALCLLVAGGSQGARRVNDLVVETVLAWRAAPPPVEVHVLWAAGSANVQAVRGTLGDAAGPVAIHLHGHLSPFAEALAAADLVVSRAGAGSVAEIALAGLPSLLLPLPSALDDHQRANARRLVDAGAAVLFDERTGTPHQFRLALEHLLAGRAAREAMAAAARAQAQPGAAEAVAALMRRVTNRM